MIKNNLSEILLKANLSVSGLSKRTGVSRVALNSIKNNKTKGIDYKTLDSLCKILKCSVGDILDYRDDWN